MVNYPSYGSFDFNQEDFLTANLSNKSPNGASGGRGSLIDKKSLKNSATAVGIPAALMWVQEIFDSIFPLHLDRFGIHPRRLFEIWEILISPFLHVGFAHLLSNTAPFIFLGLAIALGSVKDFCYAFLVSALFSGLLVWLISPTYSVTLGMSGVIFGLLTYLLSRGFFSKKIWQICLGVVVFLIYGSILLGVLPTQIGISWQCHLGGALGGVLASWWQYKKASAPKSAGQF